MTKFMNMRVPMRDTGAENSSDEGLVMSVERRDCVKLVESTTQLPKGRRRSHGQPKPFEISKWDVMTQMVVRDKLDNYA